MRDFQLPGRGKYVFNIRGLTWDAAVAGQRAQIELTVPINRRRVALALFVCFGFIAAAYVGYCYGQKSARGGKT